jgi:hypothetical protein
VEPYDFTVIDAGQPIDRIFRELQQHISKLQLARVARRPAARRTPGLITEKALIRKKP